MKRIRRIFPVLAALALGASLCPRHAAAQSTAAAEALFNDGRTAMDAKDYDTACQRFRESNRLDPAVGTRLNLAVCETSRGRLATAWELFKSVAEKLPQDDPRRDYVTSQVASIEPRLPKVTLRLAAGAPLDTKAREGTAEFAGAAFGLPLPMDPGKHVFVVEATGRESTTVEVTLSEGSKTDVSIAPGAPLPVAAPVAPNAFSPVPAGALTAAPADQPEHKGFDTRIVGWIAGSLGLAGLGVGAATGVAALNEKSTTDKECNNSLQLCTQKGKDAASSGRTYAAVSTTGWIVGAAAAGVGAYFILTSSPKGGSATTVGAGVSSGGATFSMRRTW